MSDSVQCVCIMLLMVLVSCVGCSTFKKKPKPPAEFPGLDSYSFERTAEIATQLKSVNTQKVTVRLDGLAMKDAMTLLTDETGVSIVWGRSLDDAVLFGSFFGEPLTTVLESVARRVNASVSEVNGIYFIGESSKDDVVTAVLRMIPTDKQALESALQRSLSDSGRVVVVGGSIYISDRYENVRKLMNDIEILRRHAEHAYIAEVFFIRVKEDDFVKVTGDLKIRSVDVFASTTNLDELFQMFLDASAGKGFASIEQRPVLYLSEGREAKFEVGSEIVRERRAMTESGVTQTTGYERFKDGMQLSLMLARVSPEHYAVDFELDVSTFDASKKSNDTIPPSDKSVLKLPGLLVKDSQIYYVGSLKRKDSRRVFSLFGVDTGKSNEQLTVWFRVRELKK